MQTTSRKAFTMLELTFVVVIIGILSAVAIPRFAVTRNDAVITRGRSTVASLRSALSTLRQKNILKGTFTDVNGTSLEAEMEYGLGSDWTRTNDTFTFTCPTTGTCVFTITNKILKKGTCSSTCGMDDL